MVTRGVTTSAGIAKRSGVIGGPWLDEIIVKVPVPLSASVEREVTSLEPVPCRSARCRERRLTLCSPGRGGGGLAGGGAAATLSGAMVGSFEEAVFVIM